MKSSKTGLARIFAATGNSVRGIKDCWQFEEAFRQNAILSLVLLVVSFFVAKSSSQWLLLILPLFLLLITECLNSAIEAAVDRIGLEHHHLSGRAKDAASAAVFICHFVIVTSWGAICWSNFA
jgi:diacylglycerol kinase (ATP)